MNRDERSDGRAVPRTTDERTRDRLDELLSMLATHHRRDLLYHLEGTEVTDVETLGRRMATTYEGVPIDEVSSDVLEQVLVDLMHVQLPKFADIGVIEFDPRSRTVRSRKIPPMLGNLIETCWDIEGRGEDGGETADASPTR